MNNHQNTKKNTTPFQINDEPRKWNQENGTKKMEPRKWNHSVRGNLKVLSVIHFYILHIKLFFSYIFIYYFTSLI